MTTWSSFQAEKDYTDKWRTFLEEGYKEEVAFCDQADKDYEEEIISIEEFPVDRCGHPNLKQDDEDVEVYKRMAKGQSIDHPGASTAPPVEPHVEPDVDPEEEPIDDSADESPDSEETDIPEPLLNSDDHTLTVIHFLGLDDAPLDSIHYPTDEAWMKASTEEKRNWYDYYADVIKDRHQDSDVDEALYSSYLRFAARALAHDHDRSQDLPEIFRKWLAWEVNNPEATPEVRALCNDEECPILSAPDELYRESLSESHIKRWHQLAGINPRVL